MLPIKLKWTVIALSLFLFTMPATAQLNGGKGLMHVRSAWNLEPGYLLMYSQFRFFGQAAEVGGSQGANSAYTIWDVQSSLLFHYGVTKNLEIALSPVLYQDTNRGNDQYNFIDDIFMSLRMGSFGPRSSHLKYGLDFTLRFPTANTHNIIFEPYSAGEIGFGFLGRLTYATDALYPDDKFTLHMNLGYWNHNDIGVKLTDARGTVDTIRPTENSQELLYGAGMNFPFSRFEYSLEFYGSSFITNPPITAYSREDFAYVAPAIRYKPYRWLNFDVSVDIRVLGNVDKTNYTNLTQLSGMPNYPDWRVNFGTEITLLPHEAYTRNEREVLMRRAETRRELFKEIIEDKTEADIRKEEIDKIKTERIRMERELERIKRMLEQEAARQHLKRSRMKPPPPSSEEETDRQQDQNSQKDNPPDETQDQDE